MQTRVESFYHEACSAIRIHPNAIEELEKILAEYKECNVNTYVPLNPSLLKVAIQAHKINTAIYLLEKHNAFPDQDDAHTAFAIFFRQIRDHYGNPDVLIKLALLFIKRNVNLLHPSVPAFDSSPHLLEVPLAGEQARSNEQRKMIALDNLIINLQIYYRQRSADSKLGLTIAKQFYALGDEEQALAWYERLGSALDYVNIKLKKFQFEDALAALQRFYDNKKIDISEYVGFASQVALCDLRFLSKAMQGLQAACSRDYPSSEFLKVVENFLAHEQTADVSYEAKSPQLPPLLQLVKNLSKAEQSSIAAEKFLDNIAQVVGPLEAKLLALHFTHPEDLEPASIQLLARYANYVKALCQLYPGLDPKHPSDEKVNEAHLTFKQYKDDMRIQLRYAASLIPVSQAQALNEYQEMVENGKPSTLHYYSHMEIADQLMALTKMAEDKFKYQAMFILAQFIYKALRDKLPIPLAKYAGCLKDKKQALIDYCHEEMKAALAKDQNAVMTLMRRMMKPAIWEYKEILLLAFVKYKDGSATPEMVSELRTIARELCKHKENPAFNRAAYQILEQYCQDDEAFLQEAALACVNHRELAETAAEFEKRRVFILEIKKKLASVDIKTDFQPYHTAQAICRYFKEYCSGPACPYSRETSPIANHVYDLLKQKIRAGITNRVIELSQVEALELPELMKKNLMQYAEDCYQSMQEKSTWYTDKLIAFYQKKAEKTATLDTRRKLIDCYERMSCVEMKRTMVDTRDYYITLLSQFEMEESKELTGLRDHTVCALGRSLIKNNREAHAARLFYLPAIKMLAEHHMANAKKTFSYNRQRRAGLVSAAFALLLTDPVEKALSRHEMKNQQELTEFRSTVKDFLEQAAKGKHYSELAAFLKLHCDAKSSMHHVLNPYHYIQICITSLKPPASTNMLSLFEKGVQDLLEFQADLEWHAWKIRQICSEFIEDVEKAEQLPQPPATNPQHDGYKVSPEAFPVPHDVDKETMTATEMKQDAVVPPATNPQHEGRRENPDHFPVPHDIADEEVELPKEGQPTVVVVAAPAFPAALQPVSRPEGEIAEGIEEGIEQKAEQLPATLKFTATSTAGKQVTLSVSGISITGIEKVSLDIPADFFRKLFAANQGHFALPPAFAFVHQAEEHDAEPGSAPRLLPDG